MPTEMENSAEFYYEKLKDSTNPGTVLATFFCKLYEKAVTRSEIIMFNKLITVFGKYTAFFCILDAYGSYPELTGNPYPLLYTICKKKFESAHNVIFVQSHESLNSYVGTIDKELATLSKSKKKLVIPEMESEE
jgi:hypothetical protein